MEPHDEFEAVGLAAGVLAEQRPVNDMGNADPDDGVAVRFGRPNESRRASAARFMIAYFNGCRGIEWPTKSLVRLLRPGD